MSIHLNQVWPESTDPQKFVYEDVAIASYLLVLWKHERERKNLSSLQSFADLGCGNGLLVYILSAEGHEGFGMDVRRRGIWNQYPIKVDLREEAIVPSARSLLPKTDWIIGNHSDELSPWIPVIAARSSYNCRYFLLPCCAYEFNGHKYQRKSCKHSQYEDFMCYAQTISDTCGFRTSIDRLKIPSTKRIALIGDDRVYKDNDEAKKQYNIMIEALINAKSDAIKNETSDWNSEFVPRANVEEVRNCSKIDKNVQNEIIDNVFSIILSKKRYLPAYPDWNMGGTVSLADLAGALSKAQLQALKLECGGLQTLLKNHSSIFTIRGGTVEIKPPAKYSEKLVEFQASNRRTTFNYKLKPCWFHANHPSGCPLGEKDCTFKHNS